MENMNADTPAKRLKASGNEASSDCLGVSLIIKKIMEHFSNTELLKLSRVNKQWNYEARSMLRNRGNLMAKIVSWSDCSCRRIEAFASDLSQMPIVPFSGLSLQMSHADECQSTTKGSLDPVYKKILNGLLWKRLSLKILGCFNKCKDCPVLAILVTKILENYSGVLEELSLNSDRQVNFFREYLQGRHFLRLQTFKLDQVMNNGDICQNLIKGLVHCAPNLQKVHVNQPIKVEENLLEGSSAVLVIASRFNPLYDQVCESAMSALRLKKIEVCRWRDPFNSELFNRYIPMLLQASKSALAILRMNLLFALPLMCYGICLENVAELEITVEKERMGNLEEEPILAILKSFDFTRVFPKLTKVQIFHHSGLAVVPQEISGFVERANAVLLKSLPDRAINIKRLTATTFESLGDSTILFLAQMFPALTTLWLETRDPSTFSLSLLCKHFENLEELKVKMYRRNPFPIQNFDSDLCGIFSQEVDELRERDDEYLRRVNIVPVMPWERAQMTSSC